MKDIKSETNEKYVCSDCGEEFSSDELTLWEGDYYCEDCLDASAYSFTRLPAESRCCWGRDCATCSDRESVVLCFSVAPILTVDFTKIYFASCGLSSINGILMLIQFVSPSLESLNTFEAVAIFASPILFVSTQFETDSW